MKSSIKLSLATLAVTLICHTAMAQDAPQGVKKTSLPGNFTVMLPTESSESSQDVPTELGPIKMHIFASEEDNGNTAYMVFYSDYPADAIKTTTPQELLESAQGGAVGSIENARIVAEKEIKLNGFPGKEVIFQGSSEQGDVNAGWRLFMVKNRLYQIGIISIGKPINGQKLDMVFNTFKLNQNP